MMLLLMMMMMMTMMMMMMMTTTTMQKQDRLTGAEENCRMQTGWNNWKEMLGVFCDKKMLSKIKGRIYKIDI